jgi:GT2 family glycosyltransferase
MSDLAKVSVVMITHNRRGEVLRTLARLCSACDCPPVYLVDNGSSDGTAGAVRKAFPAVEIVRLPSNIGAAARTAGVRVAHTPYVAFCDDDTWWAEGSYAVAARLLDAHPRLAAVTGKVLVGAEEREDEASVRMAASPIPNDLGVPGTLVLGMMAGACMMRRDAYLAAGGYEPRLFIGGEELLLALDLMSVGWAMAYAPEVVVHHHPSAARDVAARRRMQHRNAYWCAWLRRPWRAAARETLRLLHESVRDPVLALGLLNSLTGMAWVMRKRRPVPPAVESVLARVHAFYGGDGQARRLEALAACRAPR